MSQSMLLMVAIVVFVLMAIGLGLTIWEFRFGQPRREDELNIPRSKHREAKASEKVVRSSVG